MPLGLFFGLDSHVPMLKERFAAGGAAVAVAVAVGVPRSVDVGGGAVNVVLAATPPPPPPAAAAGVVWLRIGDWNWKVLVPAVLGAMDVPILLVKDPGVWAKLLLGVKGPGVWAKLLLGVVVG
jgi:hypothetical protein